MKYRIEIDPRARGDAEVFRDWIAETSPERAEKWFDGLFETIETLKTFPLRCPRASGGEEYGGNVRLLLYGKRHFAFRILFTVHDEVVRIVAIQHNARGSAQP